MWRGAMNVLACTAAMISATSTLAQGYTSITVKNRVTFQVPSDWRINDAEHRNKVAKSVKELLGVDGNVANFSAASHPTPSTAFLRVTFLPTPDAVTQAELNREIAADRAAALKDLRDGFNQEVSTVPGYREKIKMRGEPQFDIAKMGGQTALIISYVRGSIAVENETIQVMQYHIPLGTEKALVTASYVTSNPGARAAVNRILSTMKIR